MSYFLFKTLITAVVISGISEISRRFSFIAALMAALPITSILIFIWIYIDEKNISKISIMSQDIFFLVIPSLVFFLILPFLLKKGMNFYPALLMDIAITFVIYYLYMKLMANVIKTNN